MASIITNRLRKSIAQSIYDDIFSRRNNYYYYFGKPADGSSLETTPLNTREYEGKVRRNMIAAKKIYSNDVAFVVPRFNWSSGNVYDKTSTLETGYVSSVNGPRFYVYEPQNYRVYKCINNNNGASSTVRPTSTSADNVTTADGYVWRYMYTIPAGLRNKFLTADWMPVFNSLQKRYYSDGGINELSIIKSGSGYVQANTTIEVVGDGSGAILEPVIYNGQLGDVIIKNPGRDYTRATVIVRSSASGQGAEVVADLSVGDLDSDQALVELLSTPGTVDSIDVTTIGTEYYTATVQVIGDGSGAQAQAIIDSGNQITGIRVTKPGSGYTWADLVVTPQVNPSRSASAVDVKFRVNVSPHIGHGRNAVEEFHANSLMFFGSVFSDRLSDFDVVATYKQHGIIKNIRNYDYSPNIHDQVSPNRYQLEADFGPIVKFYGGGGQGAIGRVNVTGKNVQSITVEDPGTGYKTPPTVVITPTAGGSNAAATAKITAKLDVSDVTLTYGGVGYYSQPAVMISSNSGSGGDATASISNGIGAIEITDNGGGYLSAPAITFSGGSGTGAAATAYISNGEIMKIIVTNPGYGYTSAPTVLFDGVTNNATAVAKISPTVSAITINRTGSGYATAPVVDFRGSSGISRIDVLDPGEQFSTTPTISITGGGGNGATAQARIESCVRRIVITNQGNGYVTAPTISFSGGSGNGASATAVVIGGKVTEVIITHRGWNYTSAPTIVVNNTGTGGTGFAAVSEISTGIVAINVTSPGSGYTSLPTITVIGGGASRKGFLFSTSLGVAQASIGITGTISEITVTNPGTGYTAAPTISFTGGSGSGAAAYAKVVGSVTSITMLESGFGYTTTPTAVISGGEGVGATLGAIISGGGVASCSVVKGGNNYVTTTFSNFTVGTVLVDDASHEYTITSAQTNNKASSLIAKTNSGFPLSGIVRLRKKGTSDYFYTKTTISQKLVESRFPTACYAAEGQFDVTKIPDGSTMTVTDQINGNKYYRVISTNDIGAGYGRLLLQPTNGGKLNTNMVITGPVTFTITNVVEPDFDSRTGDVLTIANSSTEFTQNQDQTLSFRTVINF